MDPHTPSDTVKEETPTKVAAAEAEPVRAGSFAAQNSFAEDMLSLLDTWEAGPSTAGALAISALR